MKYVLLVNHNHLFAKAFGEAFIGRNPDAVVSLATNANAALKHLGLRPCDLIVADTRLPEVDGLQLLLRIQQRYPYITKVVVASHITEKERRKAADCGAVLSIEKPATRSDYETVVEQVGEILGKTPDVSRGDLDPGEIHRATARQTGAVADCILTTYMGFDCGIIFLRDGKLVHAETQASRGKEALEEILSWHEGIFEKRDYRQPPRRTLDLSWQEVFSEWKKKLKKKPAVTTAVVNREFNAHVSGSVKEKMAENKRLSGIARKSRVAPKVDFNEKLIDETGALCGLQLDGEGNIEHGFNCPDPKIMKGVVSFTVAKAHEIAGIFQWDIPLSIHYLSERMNLAVLPYREKTVMLGWSSGKREILEKINRIYGEESLDPVVSSPDIPATMDAIKKISGLHGYAIFKKPLQLVVKKFSKEWSFEMLQSTARIASQMHTVLRLQGVPLQLIQLKFRVGSVFARPFGNFMLVVICHSQTKAPLLKGCLLGISSNEINKAIL